VFCVASTLVSLDPQREVQNTEMQQKPTPDCPFEAEWRREKKMESSERHCILQVDGGGGGGI
jgi:hypothetical protein